VLLELLPEARGHLLGELEGEDIGGLKDEVGKPLLEALITLDSVRCVLPQALSLGFCLGNHLLQELLPVLVSFKPGLVLLGLVLRSCGYCGCFHFSVMFDF